MTIGQTIRALRKKRRLTQVQLGALCGLSAGAISCYENGTTIPKRRVAEKIAGALGVSAGKLLEDAPPASPTQAASAGDALLHDGVLAALRELYGIVEGRVLLGRDGARKTYYVVRQVPGDFVLYEGDIEAIVRAAKASMPPLVDYMRSVRGEAGA